MAHKITLVIEVFVPEEEIEKARQYIDDEDIYDLLDMAVDYNIAGVEEDEG